MATDNAVKVDPLGLAPCFGLGCVICSIYTDYPECCGCSISGDICCINCDQSFCKRLEKEGECCALCTGDVSIITPTSCIKMTDQICCIHCGASFPCSDDVPCTFAVLGLVCCYKMKPVFSCCKIREVIENDMA